MEKLTQLFVGGDNDLFHFNSFNCLTAQMLAVDLPWGHPRGHPKYCIAYLSWLIISEISSLFKSVI